MKLFTHICFGYADSYADVCWILCVVSHLITLSASLSA